MFQIILVYVFLAVLVALISFGAYVVFHHLRRRAIQRSLELTLFLIKIPKEEVKAGQAGGDDFKKEITKSEQLFANLLALHTPFVFEAAVPHVGEEIHFYISVPRIVSEVAVKQIQSLWPSASVARVTDDYTIFNSAGATAAAYLMQKENFALPIRTYREMDADTFASVVGAFSKVNAVGEGAAFQVIASPAPKSAVKSVQGYIVALKKGETLERVFGHEFPVSFEEIHEALSPEKLAKANNATDRIVDDDAVKILDAKISKPLFSVNMRLLASAGSAFQADDILEGLIAGFSQVQGPRRNAFKVVKAKNPKTLAYEFAFREFSGREQMILNAEEIASVYHLPISSTETPRVKWLKSKEAPPPSNMPSTGVVIGESIFRGETRKVCVTDDDRRRHIYIVGQTGTGKSTLMMNMIVDDIRRGKGVAMIDPHGDLAEDILGFIPKERVPDLIYFDPSDIWRPLGLNMLDYNFDRPEEKTFIVNEMQSIFNKLFTAETMGPMFEQYMRNALLLLMEDASPPAGGEPATLIEVPRIFTDTDYRTRKLGRIKNPVVIDFWEKEAVKAGGEASLANMTPYITSKFNNFISNDYMRPIIGQPKSAFNFREAMDSGKILLVNLSKGRIGDINAGLLGMVVTGKLLMAALSRVDTPNLDDRRDFNLYIDEFQNFTTDSIATILSEARKYRLSLVMAHQFIAQLTEKIRDAVFGNVGTQIVFRVGVQDAEFLGKQFTPTFSESDLIAIDNRNAYMKLLVNGETTKPFNIHTLSPEEPNREVIEKLKEYSRTKYGADRQTVEEEIYKRLRV